MFKKLLIINFLIINNYKYNLIYIKFIIIKKSFIFKILSKMNYTFYLSIYI